MLSFPLICLFLCNFCAMADIWLRRIHDVSLTPLWALLRPPPNYPQKRPEHPARLHRLLFPHNRHCRPKYRLYLGRRLYCRSHLRQNHRHLRPSSSTLLGSAHHTLRSNLADSGAEYCNVCSSEDIDWFRHECERAMRAYVFGGDVAVQVESMGIGDTE